MTELVLPLTLVVVIAVIAFVSYYLHSIRRPEAAITFENEREERLTRRMAETVCCLLTTALASIRKELCIAPDQTDETILKRALYHYRTALPEKVCSVFFDKSRG
jgi:hypothetical protein